MSEKYLKIGPQNLPNNYVDWIAKYNKK